MVSTTKNIEIDSLFKDDEKNDRDLKELEKTISEC